MNEMKNGLSFLEEIRNGTKKINRGNWFVVLLIGVLILVIMLPTKNNDSYFKAEEEKEVQNTISEQENMQKSLSHFLSKIDGVGKVETLIYTKKEAESVYDRKTENIKITGVIIGAEGATNETIRLQIIKMVMALYDLEADAVEVYPLIRSSSE